MAGGTASGTQVQFGLMKIASGAIVSGTVVSAFAGLELLGGAALGDATISSGGTLLVGSGEVLSNYVVSSGVDLAVVSGGTTVNASTTLVGAAFTFMQVSNGGVASGTLVGGGDGISISGTKLCSFIPAVSPNLRRCSAPNGCLRPAPRR